MASPIPQGFTTVTPHLILDGGVEMLDFYKNAFGADITSCMPGPNNLLMHAEMAIGKSIVMLGSNQWGDQGPKSPKQLGGSGCYVHLYVEDTDSLYKRAIDAGAEEIMPPADMFWGDRYAQLRDPSGHVWSIATHLEDLTEDEIAKRGEAWFAQMGGECG